MAKGFGVARTDVASDEPAETVARHDPGPGSFAGAAGPTVTLTVSKGPTQTRFPR